MTMFPNRCRSCNAAIRWERTSTGKSAPVSIETGESHFIDCPDRREWRKRGPAPHSAAIEKQEASSDGQRPLWD